MSAPTSVFVFSVQRHAPIQVGARRLTPVSRTIGLRLPWVGWAWHFPVAVEVEEAGRVTRLPIADPTRLAIVSLIVATALVLLIIGMVKPHR